MANETHTYSPYSLQYDTTYSMYDTLKVYYCTVDTGLGPVREMKNYLAFYFPDKNGQIP
jgi:hypothetical protein